MTSLLAPSCHQASDPISNQTSRTPFHAHQRQRCRTRRRRRVPRTLRVHPSSACHRRHRRTLLAAAQAPAAPAPSTRELPPPRALPQPRMLPPSWARAQLGLRSLSSLALRGVPSSRALHCAPRSLATPTVRVPAAAGVGAQDDAALEPTAQWYSAQRARCSLRRSCCW